MLTQIERELGIVNTASFCPGCIGQGRRDGIAIVILDRSTTGLCSECRDEGDGRWFVALGTDVEKVEAFARGYRGSEEPIPDGYASGGDYFRGRRVGQVYRKALAG